MMDTACAGQAVIWARVEEWLGENDGSGFMGVADQPLQLKPEESGERIGFYKLLQQIGEGGFGVVWMAEQEQPVRRRVALKIIKLGMDTKEAIARFEQERQAVPKVNAWHTFGIQIDFAAKNYSFLVDGNHVRLNQASVVTCNFPTDTSRNP